MQIGRRECFARICFGGRKRKHAAPDRKEQSKAENKYSLHSLFEQLTRPGRQAEVVCRRLTVSCNLHPAASPRKFQPQILLASVLFPPGPAQCVSRLRKPL